MLALVISEYVWLVAGWFGTTAGHLQFRWIARAGFAANDHKTAKYSFVDSERVGIFGTSAGGYGAAHAMLVHPEFLQGRSDDFR